MMTITFVLKETLLRLFIHPLRQLLLLLLLMFLLAGGQFHLCESLSNNNNNHNEISRRNAVKQVAAVAAGCGVLLNTNNIVTNNINTNVVANAATISSTYISSNFNIVPNENNMNPSPILSIPMSGSTCTTKSCLLNIPRVGYSLYKTPIEQVQRGTEIALRSGIYHIDIATQYTNSTIEVGKAITNYLTNGRQKLCIEAEKSELIESMDSSYAYYQKRNRNTDDDDDNDNTIGNNKGILRRFSDRQHERRDQLFISHKLSNDEQSIDPHQIKQSIQKTIELLGPGVDYLDMVSIHSSLTDKERRVTTYKTLLELQNTQNNQNNASLVRAIGVCNYGIQALQEIQQEGLPFPQMNQLEISPFNQHTEIVKFCNAHGIAIACSPWSKLSGIDGPTKEWKILSELAASKNVTKAQLLVKWSLQKGYICVPRSSSKYKLERIAIIENSYGGTNLMKTTNTNNGSINTPPFILSNTDMKLLKNLDISYKAGRLGRRDGWTDADVVDSNWDPTEVALL